ncbi:putative beta-1 4-xylosyltransferase IRX9 [Prunus yedoensis var. nudiflora]|uniref:Glycosyltransferases n=1 Tax=Prunus yedoensis var. nudiflora TaxID=2094558 RepID=A0A315B3Y0_PRUYE|nr:putative beta-1 4-xylosyltransferase IRX9 [Prunus yedoensis var. nudiflora]
MGITERSKKRVQLWKRAVVHFALCFVMGFFTGFAPTDHLSPRPVESPQQVAADVNRSLIAETPIVAMAAAPARPKEHTENSRFISEKEEQKEEEKEPKLTPRRFIIIVTPTSTKNKFKSVLLRRLANTIRLVPQPLLWIVVEAKTESNGVSEALRKTGIMYRHLVFKENFTDTEAEMDHQRNIALKHIEQHKLSGIVHFAGLSNVYDLGFFDQLREIEVFGTWPMALLAANREKVIIEGPVCDSSQVIGWHLKKMKNQTDPRPPIHISSFAFNSSILWDPERWGRTSSLQSSSQNSIKFVKEVVLEDETKLKGIPPEDCSKIMLWSLRFHAAGGATTTKHQINQ